MKRFYAIYENKNTVLVFNSESERDDYIYHESLVHPECVSVSDKEIKTMIEGKEPIYDKEFGCLTIRA